MISKSLSKIILVSFGLHLLHMVEVVWSGFPALAYSEIAERFASINDAIYYSSHLPLYAGFMLFYFSHRYVKVLKWSLVAYAWVFISESHHCIRAMLNQQYYPGALTSFVYIIVGFFYIRQLNKDFFAHNNMS